MRIVVPVKCVPDLVEELELNDDETDVDREFLKFVISEWDDQALEEALLVKEATGGEVVMVGFGDPDVELSLYTALAKGADRAVNLTGLGEGWVDSHTRAAVLGEWLGGEGGVDLVMAGVQAVDDLDGQLPALLGPMLGWPHVAVVIGVEASPPAGAGAGISVRRLYAPEKTGHAEMLTGSPEEVADRILELVRSKGLLK